MEITPITENNIGECVEVFLQAYNQPPWNYEWNNSEALIYLKEYVSSPQFVGYFILDNNEVAGALLAHTKTWWNSKQLFVDELFISPKFQKKGYGDKLMTLIEEYSQANDLQTITLMTHKFMPAMQFYTKKDFLHAQPFVILFKTLI